MLPQLDQFNLHHRIAENESPTIVLFSSAGCSACRHLKRILELLSNARPEWPVYEIDAQRDMALTREFEVFHLPSLFLFNQGEFHGEISSQASLASLEEAVEQALRHPPQEAP